MVISKVYYGMQGGETLQVSYSVWRAWEIVVLIGDPSNFYISGPDDPGGVFQP